MPFDVSSIGFYVLDILGRPVTAIPPRGTAAFIDEIRITVAGTAGGTAVICALLGLKTRAVGTVGDDELAAFLLNRMSQVGIDTAMVRPVPGIPTSASILPVRPNGERPVLYVPGSTKHFTVAEADYGAALDAQFVHVGGTGLLPAFDGRPTLDLLKEAKRLGRTTTFDLIQAQPDTFGLVEPLLPYIDFFMPSLEEAAAMAGCEQPDDVASFFLDRGVGACAITRGAAGSLIRAADGTRIDVPAFDVKVSDTTGCGDAYTAGFIAGLHRGWDLETCGRFASATAALVATGLGSDAGVRSFDATLRAMQTMTPRASGT